MTGANISMRRILLALVVLGLSMPAEAARRDAGKTTTASRPASSSAQAVRPAAAPARPQAARPAAGTARAQATRRDAAPSRYAARPGDTRTSRAGIATRSASAATVSRAAVPQTCTRRNGRTSCTVARSQPLRWQAGLPAADYAQRDCPAGTFATLARGHDDVVRCMPE